MEATLAGLPADAVEQCNGAIPRDTEGRLKYPRNEALNGYVSQFHQARACEADGLSTCERLQQQGSPGVGKADVFVSWFLQMPLSTLLDALRQFIEQQGSKLPRGSATRFWVCDFVIRQGAAAKADVARLGECVSAVGHTVLMLEPWDDPQPLRRAYCIKEVYHTQISDGRFDVAMSTAQAKAFEEALENEFDSIKKKLSAVDVRSAQCLKKQDQDEILRELERDVGFEACNALVSELLRAALASAGHAALDRMPDTRRNTSVLVNQLAMLLHDHGDLNGAATMFRDALKAHRKEFGSHDERTLQVIGNYGLLLKDQSEFKQAERLLREALKVRRKTLGNMHAETVTLVHNLGELLAETDRLEEAAELLNEDLETSRALFGDQHEDTIKAMSSLATVLEELDDDPSNVDRAQSLYREALQISRATLGDRHPTTIGAMNNLGQLLQNEGDLKNAEALYVEALSTCRETLGDQHPDTLNSMQNMGLLLEDKGDLEGAATQLKTALNGMRETLGDQHKETWSCVGNLGKLLKGLGQKQQALVLLQEYADNWKRWNGGDAPPSELLKDVRSLAKSLKQK